VDVGGGVFLSKVISHVQGKGSLTHNNREFQYKNVDPERTKDNIVYLKQPLKDAYDEIFGLEVKKYNERQNRQDRQIRCYYEHLFGNQGQKSVVIGSNKQKSFYETLVQIGNKDDSGVGSMDGEIVTRCLDDYMRSFQERNPNFRVFNAVLHLDEATPHLHIDYIPIGHYKRGMGVQNGLAQALKEMGYGTGKDAVSRWRIRERRVLEDICRRYGIEIAPEGKSRGVSLTTDEYKAIKDAEKEKIENEISNKKSQLKTLEVRQDYYENLGKTLSGQQISNITNNTKRMPITGHPLPSKDDWNDLIATATQKADIYDEIGNLRAKIQAKDLVIQGKDESIVSLKASHKDEYKILTETVERLEKRVMEEVRKANKNENKANILDFIANSGIEERKYVNQVASILRQQDQQQEDGWEMDDD